MAVPLLKRGFNLAKPHLKTAATNIVGDVVSNIVRNTTTKQQEGNGLMVDTKRTAKRPPSRQGRRQPVSKNRKTAAKTRRGTKNKSGVQ